MDFKLKDARPIWQQLADQMTESIVTGEYKPGERFPSVRDLALQAGVNPNTSGLSQGWRKTACWSPPAQPAEM